MLGSYRVACVISQEPRRYLALVPQPSAADQFETLSFESQICAYSTEMATMAMPGPMMKTPCDGLCARCLARKASDSGSPSSSTEAAPYMVMAHVRGYPSPELGLSVAT